MTLPSTEVRKIVKEKKTKFATVTFIKKDGTKRMVNGLFRPTSKIIGNERGKRVGAAFKRNGLIPIFSVSEMEWKCFNENNVISIT